VCILQHKGEKQGDNFPYRCYPTYFRRQPIELELLTQIPPTTKGLIDMTDPSDRVRPSVKKRLESWLGHSVKFGFDIWWHQFGGQPWLVQGPERIVCANEKCSWARRKWAMKILASVINDPLGGLPMIESTKQVKANNGHFNNSVQVVFHLCPSCLSIHAANRCD
jgi:hypothetical protein